MYNSIFTPNKKHSNYAKLLGQESTVKTLTPVFPEIWGYWTKKLKGVEYLVAFNYVTGELKHSNMESEDAEDGINKFKSGYGRYTNLDASQFICGMNKWQAKKDCAITTPRGDVPSFYAKYHKKYSALEMGKISIKADRKTDAIHEWEIIYRIFVFKNDLVAYDENGEQAFSDSSNGKYYNKDLIKWVQNVYEGYFNMKFCKESMKFFDGNDPENLYNYSPWNVAEKLKRVAHREDSKNKVSLDSLELTDVDSEELFAANPPLFYNWERSSGYRSSSYVNDIVKFEIINPNYCVFRMFVRGSSYDNCEKARIFVDGKGKLTYMERRLTASEEFTITSKPSADFVKHFIPIGFEKMYEFPRLKYISKILEDNKNTGSHDPQSDKRIELMATLLRHPVIEMLYKSGYPTFAMKIVKTGAISAYINELFGVKESKKPLYTMLNTNKYVLKWIEDYYNAPVELDRYNYPVNKSINSYLLIYAEEIVGCELKFCNESTINTVLTGMTALLKASSNDYRSLVTGQNGVNHWYHHPRRPIRVIPEAERNRAMQLFRLNEKNPQFIKLLNDVDLTLHRIHDRPQIDFMHITDYDQLVRIHDLLIEIKNREDAERDAFRKLSDAEKAEKRDKKAEKLYSARVEKYEYSDSDFVIIVPKKPIELRYEGTALHHCLGSYEDSFASGSTDILFLRRSSEPDKHFYSIEIKNNHLVQVHGLYNKHIGIDLDAARFFFKYLTMKKFSYNRRDLTNMGTGYSYGAQERSWDEITKEG